MISRRNFLVMLSAAGAGLVLPSREEWKQEAFNCDLLINVLELAQ